MGSVLKKWLLPELSSDSEKNSGEKHIILGRELTKMFEQIVRGNIDDVQTYFAAHPEKVKGEFVVIVY